MTITRIWQGGGESNRGGTSNSEEIAGLAEFHFHNCYTGYTGVTRSFARTGSCSFFGGFPEEYFGLNIPSTRQMQIGFGMYTTSHWWDGIMDLQDAGGNQLVHWRGIDGGGGRVQLYVGGALRQTFAGFNPTAPRWVHVAFDVKIHSSAGWVKLYFNGIESMSYTGNTGNTDIVRLRFSKGISGFMTTAGTLYLDDITVNDSTGESAPGAIEDVRYLWVPANANGYHNDGIGSDGNSVDNYQLVDDSATINHDGDTTYVRLLAVDQRETYGLGSVTLTEGAVVRAVVPVAYARKEDGGGGAQLALALRLSSTDATGTARNLAADYAYVHDRFPTKPGGGAWEEADLADLEGGYVGKGTF